MIVLGAVLTVLPASAALRERIVPLGVSGPVEVAVLQSVWRFVDGPEYDFSDDDLDLDTLLRERRALISQLGGR